MKIIGHRGARGLAPENTLASLKKALDCRVDEIEIDVRVTKDLVPVVCHDRTLLRLEGRGLVIAHHTLAELQAAKEDFCTLEAAINYVGRRVPLTIEVKPRVPVQPVIDVIVGAIARGWEDADFLLGSKSQATLRALHRQLPGIEKVVIARFLSVWARHRARQVGARRLYMNQHFVWFGFVRAISRNYELYPYCLNDHAKARRWETYGLAGCITDRPDLFTPPHASPPPSAATNSNEVQ